MRRRSSDRRFTEFELAVLVETLAELADRVRDHIHLIKELSGDEAEHHQHRAKQNCVLASELLAIVGIGLA